MNKTTQTRSYAGFWRRFAAALIDGIILNIGLGIILVIFTSVVGNATLLNFSEILLGWVYFAAIESIPKQTSVGKTVVELTLSEVKDNNIYFGKATASYFAKIISTVTLFFSFLRRDSLRKSNHFTS
jgi:uncharacterized RDD family membrane protein YckC